MLEADVLASLFDEKQASARRIPVDPHKQLRYLVIDDQEASRQTLKICIQSMGGFSVDQAQTFNEAYHRIRALMPDVIICDYILGPGRTGQQMLEELRRSDTLPDTVAFLMVTAERSYEQVVSAVELAPDDYIIKPFTPEALRTRLDRVIRKKIFFRHFYELKRNGDFDGALADLDALAEAEDGRPYRFDILRARAETLLKASRAQEALDAFTAIIAIHPFPWALAGQARALQRLNRYDEANEAVDNVLAAAPNYFDAYDLKADICCDLGEFDKAQTILQQVAERTPRNWRRKRILSNVAKLNGDFETSRTLIEEVIANDRVSGVPVRDRIALLRTALAGGDTALAQATLGELTPTERELLSPVEQLNLACLEAMSRGGAAGEKQFERIRSELGRADLSSEESLDAIRAALQFSDRQLADLLAEKLLTGPEAKRAFHTILDVFRDHGMEGHFRQLQRAIAARRMERKH
jgi:DNA-binding NarL/FixJ family response regulator